jgi:hypothetical protein
MFLVSHGESEAREFHRGRSPERGTPTPYDKVEDKVEDKGRVIHGGRPGLSKSGRT